MPTLQQQLSLPTARPGEDDVNAAAWSDAANESNHRLTRTRVVIGCALANLFSLPTTLLYTFGVFALAIADDFGWSRQDVAAMIGPALLLNMLSQPVCGWIVQRFHKPTVAVLSSIGLAAGCVLLALAPAQPLLFAATLMLANLLGALASPMIHTAIISQVFDKNRGTALGVVTGCIGLGVAILPMLTERVIAASGWRTAYIVLAVPPVLVGLLNIYLLRGFNAPQPAVQATVTMKDGLLAALRQPTFWLMAGLFFLLAFTANSVPLHLPLILQERGSSAAIGAVAITVTGIVMTLSRPSIGFLIDRLPVRAVLIFMLLGPIAGFAALVATTGEMAAVIAAAGFGVAIGGEFVCLGYMVSRAFPATSFGAVYGWLSLVLAFGGAVGPTAVSAVVKQSGNYQLALLLLMALCIVAMGLVMLLKEHAFSAKQGADFPARRVR